MLCWYSAGLVYDSCDGSSSSLGREDERVDMHY